MQRLVLFPIDRKLTKWGDFENLWKCCIYIVIWTTLSAALYHDAFVVDICNFTQDKNIYCRCATSRFYLHRPKIVEKTGLKIAENFENLWKCCIYIVIWTTLSAALYHDAFVVDICNFTQDKNIYCRCATSRFYLHRPKIVEKTGLKIAENFENLWKCCIYIVIWTTLSAALYHDAFVVDICNFTQDKNIYCRCATSRFYLHRPKIVEKTGLKIAENFENLWKCWSMHLVIFEVLYLHSMKWRAGDLPVYCLVLFYFKVVSNNR